MCLEEFHSSNAGPLAHRGHAGRCDDEHGMRHQQQQHERPFHSSCVPIHAQADTHRRASQTEDASGCLTPEPTTLNQNQNTHRRVSRQRLHVRAGGLQLRVCATQHQRDRAPLRLTALRVALHRRQLRSRASIPPLDARAHEPIRGPFKEASSHGRACRGGR